MTLVGEGTTKIAFVSAADVLAYAVVAVDHPAARNAEIWIGGPAPASYSEAAAAAGRALGRPLPVRYVPPGEPLPLLPETMAQLLASMETGPDQFIDMNQTSAVFGMSRTPDSIRAVSDVRGLFDHPRPPTRRSAQAWGMTRIGGHK